MQASWNKRRKAKEGLTDPRAAMLSDLETITLRQRQEPQPERLSSSFGRDQDGQNQEVRTSEGQLTAQKRDSEWMGGTMPRLDLAGRRSGGGAERRFMDAVKRGRGVS